MKNEKLFGTVEQPDKNRKPLKKGEIRMLVPDSDRTGVGSNVIGGGTAIFDKRRRYNDIPGAHGSNGRFPDFGTPARNAGLTGSVSGSDSDIVTDPLGSWTGVPENPYERPIQDADDL